MSDRLAQARAFLALTDWAGLEPIPMGNDASSRRYFRVDDAVLMDSPDDDVRPFVGVAAMLRAEGLRPPRIFAQDMGRGFLLLEDFGDGVFHRLISQDPARESPLYQATVPILVTLHGMPPGDLPVFTPESMAEMIAPAFDWYRWAITSDVGDPGPVQSALATQLARVPFGHVSLRDFHVENLMWLPGGEVGLLDFQDAMVGPLGYDLASLLFDARRDVAPQVVELTRQAFGKGVGVPDTDLARILAIVGAQRNLRILGVFVRLALKFGKPRYLDFLPRVWRYVVTCAAHPGLEDLGEGVAHGLPQPTPARLKDLKARCGTVPNR